MNTDPLSSFQAGAVVTGTTTTMPLLSTTISVVIAGGLAEVTARRVFSNPCAGSIEASITLPVPVDAVVLSLRAEIDGRSLVGVARMRAAARDQFEQAIDDGKTAVLHEELIRGIHRISIGHVPPGKQVMVETVYAQSLTCAGGPARLRLPNTVGDVYGRSPLTATDDLITSPSVVHRATLSVVSADGPVTLARGQLRDGTAELVLDAPIDLTIPAWQPAGPLLGVAADGRSVSLAVTASETAKGAIDAILLLDGSGSMAELVSGDDPRTKHQAMIDGLVAAAGTLTAADRFQLYEFGTLVRPRGTYDGEGLAAAAAAACCDLGGTKIDSAVGVAVTLAAGRDILLVTDGKSYQLDPQLYTACGRRISVVLIGDDALEAMVGHLAALTGGSIFVAGADVEAAVATALLSLRAPHRVASPIVGDPQRVETLRSGMTVTAEWSATEAAAPPGLIAPRVVGAVAAALALPLLAPEHAGAFAEAHGLVCHLTSLVLVDEAGERQEGLPLPCPVPLMTPSGGSSTGSLLACSCAFELACEYGGDLEEPLDEPTSPMELPALTDPVTWATDPDGLARGDLSSLPQPLLLWLSQTAATADDGLVALAAALDIAVDTLLLGLLARCAGDHDRNAARIARAILGPADPEALAAAMTALGLS